MARAEIDVAASPEVVRAVLAVRDRSAEDLGIRPLGVEAAIAAAL